jgi:putative peptidoglycan lipid II flippase
MVPWGLVTTVVFGLISALLVLGMPVVHLSVAGYTVGYLLETIPIIFMMMLSGLWSGFLSGHGAFMASGWAHAVRWMVVIGATLLLTQLALLPLLGCAFLAGELARTGYLWWKLKQEALWGGWGSVLRSLPSVRTPYAIFGFQVLAMLAINSNFIIDKAMGSSLGPGKLSLFEYAFTLYLVPTTIISSGLLPVLFSEWSRVFYSAGGASQLLPLVRQAFWKSVVWSLPFSLAISVAASLLATQPFQVGKLLAHDVSETFWVIGCLSLGLPGVLAGLVAMRGLLVIKEVKLFLAVAISKCVMNASLNYVLMVPFGLAGIALSTALTETIAAASLYLLFRYRVRYPALGKLATAEESGATVSSS